MSHEVNFIHSTYGGLAIWEEPVIGEEYAIGVDTASGMYDGDWSVAEVIRMSDCRQVAEWRNHYDPNEWGRRVCRLGWLYNNALMAIETHPSPHGLTAFNRAQEDGYANLYMQQVMDSREPGKFTTRKGWHRTPGSTMAFLNRVRRAVKEGCVIRSSLLLREMRAIKTEYANTTVGRPKETLSSGGEHDDCVIAYALALQVRDLGYATGYVEEKVRETADPADLYWESIESGVKPAEEPVPLWDGN